MAGQRRRSKKRFGASSGPPPDLTLFLDECLGRHAVPQALRLAGALVICHHEIFPPGTDDRAWLSALAGKADWLILTKDARIRRRSLEREAMMHAGLEVFALTSGNLTGDEQGAAFVRALERIRRIARLPGPFIARVTRFGSVGIVAP
jgi:hypothetical protein